MHHSAHKQSEDRECNSRQRLLKSKILKCLENAFAFSLAFFISLIFFLFLLLFFDIVLKHCRNHVCCLEIWFLKIMKSLDQSRYPLSQTKHTCKTRHPDSTKTLKTPCFPGSNFGYFFPLPYESWCLSLFLYFPACLFSFLFHPLP